MTVIEIRSILQVISEIDVMLPRDIQAHLLVEFPFESDAEREIRHHFVIIGVLIALGAIEPHSDAQEDIRGIGPDTLVVLIPVSKTEEVELRHDVGIDELVLPFGIQLHRHLPCLEIVLVSGNTLGGELRLNRPPFRELIAEMQAECLAGVHEDMLRGVAYIIAAATLQAELAEEGLTLRTNAHTRTREQ